jgi:hypothetical protein
MVHDGFGNAWANDDERGDPDDMRRRRRDEES